MLDLSAVTTIFFDADNTLTYLHPSMGTTYSAHLARYGISASPQAIDQITPQLWADFIPTYRNEAEGYRTSPERERAVWREFARRIVNHFGETTQFDQLFEELFAAFSTGENRRLAEGATELLQSLQAHGYKTGVLSNCDERIVGVLNDLGLGKHINWTIPTTTLGYKKPARKCFDNLCRRIETSAQEMVYVGDDYETDYLAARAAGWQAVWYHEKHREGTEGLVVADSFERLQQLLIRKETAQ